MPRSNNDTEKNLYLGLDSEDAINFANTLKDDNNIKRLGLNFYNLGEKAFEKLAEAFNNHSTLIELRLVDEARGDDRLSEQSIGFLTDGLKNNSTLTHLHYQIPAGFSHLADALIGNRTLTHLTLHSVELDDKDPDALGRFLVCFLKDNRSLTHLTLSNMNLNEQSTGLLVKALKSNTTLTTLTVPKTDITSRYHRTIPFYIERNNLIQQIQERKPDLTALIFGKVRFNDQSAQVLLEALQTNDFITELEMSWKSVSPEIRSAIESKIKNNQLLKENSAMKHQAIQQDDVRHTPVLTAPDTGARVIEPEEEEAPESLDEAPSLPLVEASSEDERSKEESVVTMLDTLGLTGFYELLGGTASKRNKNNIIESLDIHMDSINNIETLHSFFKEFIQCEQHSPCLRVERGFFHRKANKLGRTDAFKKVIKLFKARALELIETYRDPSTTQINITGAQDTLYREIFAEKRARKGSLARWKKPDSLKNYERMTIGIIDHDPDLEADNGAGVGAAI